MIKFEDRKRGQPTLAESRPSQLIYVKCEVCGATLPDPIPWPQLPDNKYSLCPEHKSVRILNPGEYQLERCMRLKKGYWSVLAPVVCHRSTGNIDCLQCTLTDCEWNENELWKESEPEYKTPVALKNGHKTSEAVCTTQKRLEATPARNATFGKSHSSTGVYP